MKHRLTHLVTEKYRGIWERLIISIIRGTQLVANFMLVLINFSAEKFQIFAPFLIGRKKIP
jgi:hypothetical protein